MHFRIHTCARAVLIALLATGLTACGSLSKNIAEDGSGAGQLTWPAPTRTDPLHKGGTYPTLASLRAIRAGMSKNQVIALIGPPQFNEGFWQVRDWDYLFTLPKGDGTALCQYKILFDTHMIAQSFYWRQRECADLVHQTPKVASESKVFTLSADALFGFDSYHVGTKGRAALDALARQSGGARVIR